MPARDSTAMTLGGRSLRATNDTAWRAGYPLHSTRNTSPLPASR